MDGLEFLLEICECILLLTNHLGESLAQPDVQIFHLESKPMDLPTAWEFDESHYSHQEMVAVRRTAVEHLVKGRQDG